jgi:putative ABC transport system permease protein
MILYWSIIKVALRSLIANKMRSALTMLGIIIGVAAVMAMMSIGEGARESILDSVRSWGTNRLSLRPGSRGNRGVASDSIQSFTILDAQRLLELDSVDLVSPEARGSAQAKAGNRNARTSLIGVSNTYFPMFNFEIDKGRVFTAGEEEHMRRVCVLGPKVVEKLFGTTDADPIGEYVKLNGEQYLIVGTTVEKGDAGWFNPDDQVFMPYSTLMKRVLGTADLTTIHIRVVDESKVSETEAAVRAKMREVRKLAPGRPDDFFIHNSKEMLDNLQTFTIVFQSLIVGIASISLLVGGIGIMNIMLVTVTERTREIGIRKALGAKNRSILFQFVMEAVVVCLVGGLIGIAIGVAIVYLFNFGTRNIPDMFRANVSEAGLLLGFGVSLATGLFFGIYPAAKASRLDPIDALRYE